MYTFVFLWTPALRCARPAGRRQPRCRRLQAGVCTLRGFFGGGSFTVPCLAARVATPPPPLAQRPPAPPCRSPKGEHIPHGMIFACFMVSCMVGSAVAGRLLANNST